MSEPSVRWGIIGCGQIAHRLADGINSAANATLTAVASRSADKAAEFGRQHGAEKALEGYQTLLDDSDVQVAYIALPNHMHAEWTVRAARAGKHILCEKPFAVNVAQAEEMIAAARQAGVFLMEAFMYRCEHPATERLLEIVRSGLIGELHLLRMAFGYKLGPRYENIRLSNTAAGGALMDVGCYPISLARLLAGGEPVEISAVAKIGEISRVDETFAGLLKFPSGLIATMTAATQVAIGPGTEIWGSEGRIRIDHVYNPPAEGHTLEIVVGDESRSEVINIGKTGAQVEVEHVSRRLDKAESPGMSWDDTLGNQRVLDDLRREIGLVFDCER
jgi:predicted dehydrogenase